MSSSLSKGVPTLKGLFTEPRTQHRRNFLRENKLSLREKQQAVGGKQAEQQQKLQRGLPPQRQHQHAPSELSSRRSVSQPRSVANGQSQSRPVGVEPGSLQRSKKNAQPPPASKLVRCPSCCGSGTLRSNAPKESATNVATSCSKQSQTEDIHDEQFLYEALKRCSTYDGDERGPGPQHHDNGLDEHFDPTQGNAAPLHHHGQHEHHYHGYDGHHDYKGNYNPETASQGGLTLRSQPSIAHFQPPNPESARPSCRSTHAAGPDDCQSYRSRGGEAQFANAPDGCHLSHHSRQMPPHSYGQHGQYAPPNGDHEPHTVRSTASIGGHMPMNGAGDGQDALSGRSRVSQTSHRAGSPARGHGDFVEQRSMYPKEECAETQTEPQPLSGRSDASQVTVLTKKRSVHSMHKLGSRDDVSLPRYLEREKREKEAQMAEERMRDPNCPPGHYLLTEAERRSALEAKNKKFEQLISELNHMPMTTQTLRIQRRKGEIEKELIAVENDIRLFSKARVYVKQDQY